jgi:tetratricopeptide (TPR) repeat protein
MRTCCRPMASERPLRLALIFVTCTAVACAAVRGGSVHAELEAAVKTNDALAVSDALEKLIATGTDTPADHQLAYDAIRTNDVDTAPATFARAAVTGRLVQQRGLLGADLVDDVERDAMRSRELDPDFRDGAATRLLGTLYVIAPATYLEHGDSERGLELLEGLVEARPDIPENHLRVAEAYIALRDPDPALPHLCRALEARAALRWDDQALLDRLVGSVGGVNCGSVGD